MKCIIFLFAATNQTYFRKPELTNMQKPIFQNTYLPNGSIGQEQKVVSTRFSLPRKRAWKVKDITSGLIYPQKTSLKDVKYLK